MFSQGISFLKQSYRHDISPTHYGAIGNQVDSGYLSFHFSKQKLPTAFIATKPNTVVGNKSPAIKAAKAPIPLMSTAIIIKRERRQAIGRHQALTINVTPEIASCV